MRLTLVHPCVGRYAGDRSYIRSWQMEPLPVATIAGLTPPEIERRFYDDRLEDIPYDEPTDLVAISVETYTAKRAYQIASRYRERGVPVVMGGFHASLEPEEVARHAESVVIGEAEDLWARVIDDARSGRIEKFYRAGSRPSLDALRPDRTVFRGKRYLKMHLVEAGRGCRFKCDFCAIQTVFGKTQSRRPVDRIVEDLRPAANRKKLVFFVDDNVFSNIDAAKELLRAITPLNIRWVSQMSINAAYDEEFLELLVRSGCAGVLIGFESLEPENLRAMGKEFNLMRGGPADAMDRLNRAGVRVYGTFIFGYAHDTPESFDKAVGFARDKSMFIAAFNHLTPFPGTPLYNRLEKEGRLRFERWWLDAGYRYNMVPFTPTTMPAEELERRCLDARRSFFSLPSILSRGVRRPNRSDAYMARYFTPINLMLRRDVEARSGMPLGDEAETREPLRAC